MVLFDWGVFTLDVRQQLLPLWVVGNEALDCATDHGVLAHQDNGIASQSLANLVHLLG
jgi:hypothetical protein